MGAHEKVREESVALERFPQMGKCIKQVVGEARYDLQALCELQPARFFFAKHSLALRVILNRRLTRLEKYVHHGWINKADAEGIIEELRDRIIQVDLFFPGMARRHPQIQE